MTSVCTHVVPWIAASPDQKIYCPGHQPSFGNEMSREWQTSWSDFIVFL